MWTRGRVDSGTCGVGTCGVEDVWIGLRDVWTQDDVNYGMCGPRDVWPREVWHSGTSGLGEDVDFGTCGL